MELLLPMDDRHELTLADLYRLVKAQGGNLRTPLVIEADGEPVYIYMTERTGPNVHLRPGDA
jgi:hypothetical protein